MNFDFTDADREARLVARVAWLEAQVQHALEMRARAFWSGVGSAVEMLDAGSTLEDLREWLGER